jgi:hypothetical protein
VHALDLSRSRHREAALRLREAGALRDVVRRSIRRYRLDNPYSSRLAWLILMHTALADLAEQRRGRAAARRKKPSASVGITARRRRTA